jgi:hypothetical protein
LLCLYSTLNLYDNGAFGLPGDPMQKNADSSFQSETVPWADPLLLEDQLNDDEHKLCHAVRAYCAERLLPRIVEAARNERFDREIVAEQPSNLMAAPPETTSPMG